MFLFGTKCLPVGTGDFCGEQVIKDNYWAFTRKGVEVPFRELMYYETTSSYGECEGMCENNCSCWGAVYNNGNESNDWKVEGKRKQVWLLQ